MRKEELTDELRKPFSPSRGFGTARVDKAGYENIWFVVPPPPPQEVPPGLPVGVVAKANAILQARPAIDEASELDRLSAYLFARREAVSSSRMEGTWSTVDNVLTPGDVYDREDGKSERLAVRGYATAIEHGLSRIRQSGIEALTAGLVCELHELVMSKDPDFKGVAGRLRAPGLPGEVVQIEGLGRKEEAIYNPAPPEHVDRCLEVVMAWMRDRTLIELGDAGMGMSLPLRMAVAHAHFEAVHPFGNGNGRVGRLLWPLQMAAAGRLPLYLSDYVEMYRNAYARALEEAQKRLEYGPIVGFVAESIVASDAEERSGKAAIGSLSKQWAERGRFRKDSAAALALTVLMRLPVITVRTLAAELKVSFQAASNALRALEDRHIVRERTGHGRNRVFAAEEVIAVLARPFAEDPEIALEGARRALGVA